MPLQNGARLGPYEVVSPLGAGGMGEVYRARDPRLGREVAIKVLPDLLSKDPDALTRFEREARAVAALNHPNILSIFDFGNHEGTTYAAMELLEGETLRDRLRAGAIPEKRAVEYASQIAAGLSAAHDRGIVHRDLKPENIFLLGDGRVKILDFGLATKAPTLWQDDASGARTIPRQTEPGTILGTLSYMSPEQVRGKSADFRSDIFSYGAVLYEMLSGQRAFGGSSAADTISAILHEEPPELSRPGRSVSSRLDHIVRHCLEKDREIRFQSARDIAFALSEASSPAVTSGEPLGPARSGKGRALVAAAAVVAIAAAGALVVRRSREGAGEIGGSKRIAVLPFENLGSPEDDYFTDGIADAVRGKLTSLPGVEVIARDSSTHYKKTTKTLNQIARELEAKYLLTAAVRWQKSGGTSRVQVSPELVEVRESGAPSSRWQQSFDETLTEVFQVQSDIASRVARALGVALGIGEERRLSHDPTQNLAAYDAFLKGEEVWSSKGSDSPSVRKALGFFDQAVVLDPGFALAWAYVSRSNSNLWGNGATPELAERARQAAEKAVALAPDRPEGYVALGTYERLVAGDFGRALEQFSKGRHLAPANSDLLRGEAATELSLGKWNAGVEHLRQAARLDPRSLSNLTALGIALLGLRRYSDAREANDRGLAIAPADLNLVEGKAMTYLAQGDLAGARTVIGDALRNVEPTALVAEMANSNYLVWVLDDSQRQLLLRLTPGMFDGDKGDWGLCLAQAYALKDDAGNVRLFAEEARRAVQEQLRAVPDEAMLHAKLGLALAYLGRREEAIREGERAVAILPVSKDALSATFIQHQLVRIYILAGEKEKAMDQLEPLLKIPYYLSSGWLRIDPNFDPLRKTPRFQKLVQHGQS